MLRLMGSPKGIISAQLQATESKGSCGSKRPFGIEPVIGAPVGEDLTRGPQQDGCGVPAETDELAEHREPGPGEDALLAEEGGARVAAANRRRLRAGLFDLDRIGRGVFALEDEVGFVGDDPFVAPDLFELHGLSNTLGKLMCHCSLVALDELDFVWHSHI